MTTTFDSLYDVVLTGELIGQTSINEAAAGLANLFKVAEERALQMLNEAPKIIKSGVDAATAAKYEQAMGKLGVKVDLRPQAAVEAVTPASVAAVASEPTEPVAARPVAPVESVTKPASFEGLSFSIEGRPDFAFLNVKIPPNQTLKVEASAMATMDTNLQMKTKMKGGFTRLLSGESIFMNEFTAEGGQGEIGIAPAAPGDLVHQYLRGNTIYLQNSALVACTPGVNIETKWQGFTKGFFSGESLFLIRASGEGDLWFNSYGAIIEIDVEDGYVVDTGNIVAFTEGLEYSISKVGGYKSLFFSGEGFVCRFTGKGKLWIQTRSVGAFTGWAHWYRPVKSSK
jgi:uncharacterized protein (TIGR00266 family)